MNRHMEHGFRRCGALREGIYAHVTLVADASNACDLDGVRAAARDLSAETRRFEAAWTELYKNYRRGRREIDHARGDDRDGVRDVPRRLMIDTLDDDRSRGLSAKRQSPTDTFRTLRRE